MRKEPWDMIIRYYLNRFVIKGLYIIWPTLSSAEKTEVRLLDLDSKAWKKLHDEQKNGSKS